MKKILSIIMPVAMMLTGCSPTAEVTSSEVIDTRYTAGHSEVVTEYEYKFDPLRLDLVYVPDTHSVWIDDKYEICVRYTLSDGTTEEQWEETTKEDYIKNGGEIVWPTYSSPERPQAS